MKNIPDKYIELISSVPYNVTKEYGLPYNVIINYIKKFRKNLSVDEFTEFIKYDGNKYNRMDITEKITLLDNVFGDLKFNLTEDQILEISKSFSRIKYNLFKNFMNVICDQIFVGDDVDECRSIESLLKCRSYKIYLLLNSEEVC